MRDHRNVVESALAPSFGSWLYESVGGRKEVSDIPYIFVNTSVRNHIASGVATDFEYGGGGGAGPRPGPPHPPQN